MSSGGNVKPHSEGERETVETSVADSGAKVDSGKLEGANGSAKDTKEVQGTKGEEEFVETSVEDSGAEGDSGKGADSSTKDTKEVRGNRGEGKTVETSAKDSGAEVDSGKGADSSAKDTKEVQGTKGERETVETSVEYSGADGDSGKGADSSAKDTKEVQRTEGEGKTVETSAEDSRAEGDSGKGADSSTKDMKEDQRPKGGGEILETSAGSSGAEGDIGKDADSKKDTGEVRETRRETVVCGTKSQLILVLLIAVLGIAVIIYRPPEEEMKGNRELVEVFKNGVENLQLSFTNQTDRFWKKLRTRGLAHLGNRDPPRPLVLLLAAPPAAHEWVNCLATKLAEKLDSKLNTTPITIDGEEEKVNPSEMTKKTMDNLLKEKFVAGHKVALIHHLELLPPSSPLLFHSYCDDQDAPYKDVAIIFTLYMPVEPSSSLSPAEEEESVEDYLSGEVWMEVDKTAVAALLSRITDTVVLMNGESSGSAKSRCY